MVNRLRLRRLSPWSLHSAADAQRAHRSIRKAGGLKRMPQRERRPIRHPAPGCFSTNPPALEQILRRAIYYAALGFEGRSPAEGRSRRAAGRVKGERAGMSMSWEMDYKKRLKTADEALR